MSLEPFHPLIRQWFESEVGPPTKVQQLAWPAIAAGEHVLVTAPTGTGKTLAAFLWAIDRLATRTWEPGRVRVLYVSPLRALNNDIQRNLRAPLVAIRAKFEQKQLEFPRIGVHTRSGDTSASQRRRTIRNPPEILITTPESLNILLTSQSGTDLLGGVTTVILDEVHAVASSKRGVHLITAVDRLVRLSGEFQRIALSATVRPLEAIASWVGGRESRGRGRGTEHRARPVTLIDASGTKDMDIRVRFTAGKADEPDATDEAFWEALASAVAERIGENTSTLAFANSRRKVEKVARCINQGSEPVQVWSHHGSLSREVREVVETKLKAGELDGLVATNSLELGIDVGAIDEVVLVQTPPSVSSTTQRIGRSGHGVGETSRAQLFATHAQDVLDAAVTVRAVQQGDVEPIVPPSAPLDVLAQIVLSMTCTESWHLDDLFDYIRTSAPYHELTRTQFDLTIEMLAGRYAGARLAALRPRVSVDRIDGTIRAKPGAARMIYASGGTIPDRGYYTLRSLDSNARIGELDEEFVWERGIGDSFLLGVQGWRIERITHNDVLVTPARPGSAMAPFWRAEPRQSSWWFARRSSTFLEQANDRLDDDDFAAELATARRLDPAAVVHLLDYLRTQKKVTGADLPHRHHMLIERVTDPQSEGDRPLLILHTMFGGLVNRGWAIALRAALSDRFGTAVEVIHDDGCIATELPAPMTVDEILGLVGPADVEPLLRSALETTGLFGAAFREATGRALLLPRKGFGRRTPLWLNRQRAKDLMGIVGKFDDFPILLEAWRTCLHDEMDVPSLVERLDEIDQGIIEVTEAFTSRPSPFAADVQWQRTNTLMYEDDVPQSSAGTKLRSDLISEVARSGNLRPRIAPHVVERLRARLHRTHPGYAPRDAADLIDWVKERVIIPMDQWIILLDAIERDHGLDRTELLEQISHRVVTLETIVVAHENLPRLSPYMDTPEHTAPTPEDTTAETLLAEWLRHHPPLPVDDIPGLTNLPVEVVQSALQALQDSDQIIVDELTSDATTPEVCDLENLARLLRMTRADARPLFDPLGLEALPLVLATHHGLGSGPTGGEGLRQSMEKLFGLPQPPHLYEEELLPARLADYRSSWLDALIADTDLIWLGAGTERIAFCLSPDRDLFAQPPEDRDDAPSTGIFPALPGRYSLADLAQQTGKPTAEIATALWDLAWRGQATTDGFAPVRQGVASGFAPASAPEPGGRQRFGRWKSSRPTQGAWLQLPPIDPPADILEDEQLDRDRVRILLDRHGLIFREIVARELPHLRWSHLFRTLRIMELSGEIVAGQFITGIPGLQFISPALLRRLRDPLDEERIFWINATDPASPCGLGLDLPLPRRVVTSHLVYHGRRLVVTSEATAKRITIRPEPDHPRLNEYLAILDHLLGRELRPHRALTIERINDEPAAKSPYRSHLDSRYDVTADARSLRLTRKY